MNTIKKHDYKHVIYAFQPKYVVFKSVPIWVVLNYLNVESTSTAIIKFQSKY